MSYASPWRKLGRSRSSSPSYMWFASHCVYKKLNKNNLFSGFYNLTSDLLSNEQGASGSALMRQWPGLRFLDRSSLVGTDDMIWQKWTSYRRNVTPSYPFVWVLFTSVASAALHDLQRHYHQRRYLGLYSSGVGASRCPSRSRYFYDVSFHLSYDLAASAATRCHLLIVKTLLPVIVLTTARRLWLPLGGPCILER